MARFDLRKSPVDGMIRKWEKKMASQIVGMSLGEGAGSASSRAFDDHEVWVVTGVYKHRREAFK